MKDEFTGNNADLKRAIEAVLRWENCSPATQAVLAAAHTRLLDSADVQIGYMCMTDFEDELGSYAKGTLVYPSEDAIRHRKCVQQCGIVRVGVAMLGVVAESQHPADET